jgi:hypothetical protein
MRSQADVRRVFELWDEGLSKSKISEATGVSRTQVRNWVAAGIDAVLTSPMRVRESRSTAACRGWCDPWDGLDGPAYAYLFGQYLGDGCISEPARGSPRLRITTCDEYPGIRGECERAIQKIGPLATLGSLRREGCTDVFSSWPHWPCYFPQHGRGRKHERRLVLDAWQESVVFDREPKAFLRGLIHSDGCRVMNWVPKPNSKERYTYPRYLFTNESQDIREFFREACCRLAIECRAMNRKTLSMARRASVARLDEFIGPKF